MSKQWKNYMTKKGIIQMTWCVAGSLIFAVGVNMIVTPLNLYNGGFMGISQLLRVFFLDYLKLSALRGVDVTGIIYFAINIPLFFFAWRILGTSFCVKSIITVGVQSFFLAVVPTPATPVMDDYLTVCIIGGIVAGSGAGMVLRGGSSGGGQDIIGVICAKVFPNFSVGKISVMMNVCIYAICFFIFDIQIVIYSLIYTTVLALALDRMHVQNINTTVMIFTKKMGISRAIIDEMGRGVTNWDGAGAYTNETSYILLTVISKYEVAQLKSIVHRIDQNAFMIFTEGNAVIGNFEKRLTS